MVAGLDRPTEGSISGVDASRIAYVFQDAHLLPWRNVLQNVVLPLELRGTAASSRLADATAAIESVGLADALKRYPAQLSGGMRMRVSLARALVTNPRILLLDEPFAALDEITRGQLNEQLRRLWQDRGMTVIFVTHSITDAVFLANRAVVLSSRPGRIVLDHAIELSSRQSMIRGEPEFARQTRVLLQALRASDSAGGETGKVT
jgi:NitT/TauT family transport system ATP-binding protein